MLFPLFSISVEYIIATLLGLLGIGSLGYNNFMKQVNAIDYGIKVEVDGLNMSVNIMGEQHNQTIVLLPGLGIYSPYYSFKSFNELLSEEYKVITVEPFGYGLSDVTKKERTNENIISELHTCLEKLGIDQYYLLAHSLGGIYSLAYVKKYPKEVLGFIGLDNTPTGMEELMPPRTPEDEIKDELGILIAKNHLNRFAPEEYKANNTLPLLDPNYDYSKEDLKNIDLIFGYSSISENIINENALIYDNMLDVHDAVFTCPALMILASNTSKGYPEWISYHEAMIGNKEKSEVVEFEGTHMIYLEKKKEIVKKIKEWFQKL